MTWSWASFALGLFVAAPVMFMLVAILCASQREPEAVIMLPGKDAPDTITHPWACAACQQRFTTQARYDAHQAVGHTCRDCAQVLPTLEQWSDHECIDTRSEP